MTFDDYLALVDAGKTIRVQADWGQGRTTFGGMSAALVLRHAQRLVPQGHRLRSLNVTFCGPVTIDAPCVLESTLLVSGKSVSHVTGQLSQATDDGPDSAKVCTLVTACFGVERTSNIIVNAPVQRDLGDAGQGQVLPFVKGITPDFIQNMQLQVTEGDLPFSGSKSTRLAGWARLKATPTSFENEHLLAIIDAWPPATLPMLASFSPTSSVTWQVEFVHANPNLQPQDWIYYACDVVQAEGGYGHTQAQVFHPNGELLALSRQVVTIYDKKP